MDFSWSDAEIELRRKLRTYVEENLRPGWRSIDRDVHNDDTIEASLQFCRGLAERGLLTPAWPVEYGGKAASRWAQIVISEELRGAGEPRGPQYTNVNWIGPAIMKLGTEEQKAEFLPPIAAGEAMWCQGFSEPDAGSDLSALRTFAERDGDEYIVNGQKIWTSYAAAADYCFLLVRTARSDNPRDGISILLVPMDTAGIEVREIATLDIDHMLHEVFFHNVRVPVRFRLGEENQGWSIIRTLLANERTQSSLHEEVNRSLNDLVNEARQLGIAIDEPQSSASLGKAASWVAASRVLNYVAIQALSDGSEHYPNLASVYKASSVQMAGKANEAFLAILGAQSLATSSAGDYRMISSIETGIGGGSTEMQLNAIAWQVLKLPKK
jgi:alkylation response protein AidB-like acyl-CoA dehydrogenase